MNLKPKYSFLIIMVMMISGTTLADQTEGQRLWNSVANERSCTTCHGDSPAQMGKHVKTGKVIKPMALSVNSERYQDNKKVEKWFLRNCKWTFGRQCSDGEKSDILSWLSNQ
ncbi:MAG: DUF1924 domain-containing protein [Gammaproteobacteria bacterium]|nr:DUF1924 domain-containing protein [Gammaproteobacteria bacterium]